VAQQPADNRKPDPTAATAGRILDEVRALAAELRPHHAPAGGVGLDSSLDKDLGLDSLARMELLARLEHAFDVALSEHLMASTETPRDLVRVVLGAGAREGAAAAPDVSVIDAGVTEAVPRSARTLIEVLDWHVRAHPERPHVRLYADEEVGETITYRALRDGAGRVAAGLRQRELEAGEAVIIMLPTGRDYFFSFFGVLLAGGVPVAIYRWRRRSRWRGCSGPRRAIFATRSQWKSFRAHRKQTRRRPRARATSRSCNTPRAAPATPRAWC
jgi:acyl carrier protein